jgi:hypothetical protein
MFKKDSENIDDAAENPNTEHRNERLPLDLKKKRIKDIDINNINIVQTDTSFINQRKLIYVFCIII